MQVIDIKSLAKEYITGGTLYVTQMKDEIDLGEPGLTPILKNKGVDWNNNLLQILYDIRHIPWDDDIKKQYKNIEQLTSNETEQLQSLSDLIFRYFADQDDYIPKTWTPARQKAQRVTDDVWEQQTTAIFQSDFTRHFNRFPPTTSVTTALVELKKMTIV